MESYHTPEIYGQNFALDAQSIELLTRLVTDASPPPTATAEPLDIGDSIAIIEAQLAKKLFEEGFYYYMYGRYHDKILIKHKR